jgi:N-acetylglucosaminyldiphosphoundecaprenol N-acetyl-beta-D-mannosaminyltransferase
LSEQPTKRDKEETRDVYPRLVRVSPVPVTLLGVGIVDLPASEIVSSVLNTVIAGERGVFVYINIYALNLAQSLPWFRDFLNNAALAYCDGFGVLLGARLAGYSLSHRSTPPDWISKLAAECASKSIRIFLLGGRPGVAERAASSLTIEHPGLQVCGVHHGYFDVTQGSSDNQGLIRAINEKEADLLLVGMGMPLQEKWLEENWSQLKTRVALPVGALLDYLSGEKRRPPGWMAKHGLEWVGRLYLEPSRLWKRYLLGIPHFYYLILRQKLGRVD